MCALLLAQGAPDPNRVIVIGCLERKNAELSITDFRGGSTPTYRLDAKDDKLIPWVGYTVEITGRLDGAYHAGSTDVPRLNVQKVDRISRTCTALEHR